MSEHRTHEWTRVDGAEGICAWACTECTEICATCGTCGRPSGTSLLLCSSCERAAAKVLDDIADALSYYETPPRSLIGSPGDMRLVPGFSGPTAIQTPADIESRMLSWVARWTEHTGATQQGASDYLRSHHLWAAHHAEESRWLAYLADMRRLRGQARGVAGLLPKRHPEPCVHCGGTVVQDWADRWWKPLTGGLSDMVRCLGCGTTWRDRAMWLFSTRQHIVDVPAVHPDSLVTLAQARMIWPEVPAGTWRQWAKRWRDDGEEAIERARHWWNLRCAYLAGRDAWPAWAPMTWPGPGDPPTMPGWLPERGERRGVTLYRVGDLAALVERRADEIGEVA